jgi:acyl dehydratase
MNALELEAPRMSSARSVDELAANVGLDLGVSEWVEIDQTMIDRFAEVTLDRYWAHVDPQRAARELPGGKTIAHGLLVQSLVPALSAKVLAPGTFASARSYGTNRVRYPASVQVGDRVRLRTHLAEVISTAKGVLVTLKHTMEIDGKETPAMVAEGLTIYLGMKAGAA